MTYYSRSEIACYFLFDMFVCLIFHIAAVICHSTYQSSGTETCPSHNPNWTPNTQLTTGKWMVLSTWLRIFNCIMFKGQHQCYVKVIIRYCKSYSTVIINYIPLTAVFHAQWLSFSKLPFGNLKLHVEGCYWTYFFLSEKKTFC